MPARPPKSTPQPKDPYAQAGKALASQVQRLRGWLSTDASRLPELVDALNALVAHRLDGHAYAAAGTDAQEAVKRSADLLLSTGPIGPYSSAADAVRCGTALVQLATLQVAVGLGVDQRAERIGLAGNLKVVRGVVHELEEAPGGGAAAKLGTPGGFMAADFAQYLGRSTGSGQCVALVQAASPGIGPTRTWKCGPPVQGNTDLRPGTAIATFNTNAKHEGEAYPRSEFAARVSGDNGLRVVKVSTSLGRIIKHTAEIILFCWATTLCSTFDIFCGRPSRSIIAV